MIKIYKINLNDMKPMKTPLQQLKELCKTNENYLPSKYVFSKIDSLLEEEKSQILAAFLSFKDVVDKNTIDEAKKTYDEIYK